MRMKQPPAKGALYSKVLLINVPELAPGWLQPRPVPAMRRFPPAAGVLAGYANQDRRAFVWWWRTIPAYPVCRVGQPPPPSRALPAFLDFATKPPRRGFTRYG